jgi:hypothetical protein
VKLRHELRYKDSTPRSGTYRSREVEIVLDNRLIFDIVHYTPFSRTNNEISKLSMVLR